MRRTPVREQGSTLVEALVAMLVVTTAVMTIAQLVSTATRNNISSKAMTMATVLADQKVEQLRAEAAQLNASPPDSLERDAPGFVDHVDAWGRVVGQGGPPPPNAVYTRRWSIADLPPMPNPSVLIQVVVSSESGSTRSGRGSGGRRRGGARVLTMTRKAP